MINGLGLFAALGTPESATPQPAPAEDPAVFAAALVAALGLRVPVPARDVLPVPEQGVAEDGDPEQADVEGEPAPIGNHDDDAASSAGVVVARVTPDPDAISEASTLGAMINPKPAAPHSGRVDLVSDAPARPAVVGERAATQEKVAALDPVPRAPLPETGEDSAAAKKVAVTCVVPPAPLPETGEDSAAAKKVTVTCVVPPAPLPETSESTEATVEVPIAGRGSDVAPIQANAPVAAQAVQRQPAKPESVELERPDLVDGAEQDPAKPIARRAGERRGARPAPAESGVELWATKVSVSAPTVVGAIPAPIAPIPTPIASTVEPSIAADGHAAGRASQGIRHTIEPSPASSSLPAAASASLSDPLAAPPQSVEERAARAMAENTRVARQLAELLGEAEVTEFKVQLGRRPVKPGTESAEDIALQSSRPPVTRVVWQRTTLVEAGDTIAGQRLPPEAPRVKPGHAEPPGTLGHAAAEAVTAPAEGTAISLSALTSRSEIVRMVANASRAMAPNLAATEGTPAVAKAPAPSMAPSLPVVRQELPVASSGSESGEPDGRERKPAQDAAASDAASASSPFAANNATGTASRSERPDTPEAREARNLPSHGSTDQKPAGSADRVTLQVADEEGRQTRIRVSVTGNQIRAVITPPDSATARQLEQRMDQLHETLVRQGFADPKLVVRAAPEAMSDAAAMASASGSQEGRSVVPAGKDQPAGEQRQGRGQREHDRGDGHRHPQGHSRERDPRDRRR